MTRDSITIIMLYPYNQRYNHYALLIQSTLRRKEIKNKVDRIIPAARQLKEKKKKKNSVSYDRFEEDCLGIVIATGINLSNNEASGMVDECRIYLCVDSQINIKDKKT